MGYQNSTLPIAVYECIDTCSRKMLWAKVWVYLYKMQDDLVCTLRLFADDALLYQKITHNDDTLALQRDLDKRGLWANRWQMLFNPTNYYKMSVYRSRSPGAKDYTLYNQALVAVQQHHHLGVLLSSDLRWNSHVGKNFKKGNSTLAFVKRNLYACSEETKEAAYVSPPCQATSRLCDCSMGSL